MAEILSKLEIEDVIVKTTKGVNLAQILSYTIGEGEKVSQYKSCRYNPVSL